MNTKKSIAVLIGIIGFLLILLAGAVGYILGNTNNNNPVSTAVSDDKKIMREIEELKLMYDTKIAEKTNNYKALEAEQVKVQILVSELEKSKNDALALVKYKTQYQALESKMRILVDEIVVLKNKKIKVVKEQVKPQIVKKEVKPTVENTVANVVITPKKEVAALTKVEVVKPQSDDFFAKKELPKQETVTVKKPAATARFEKYSKVSLSGVKAAAFGIKSATKQVETTTASKTDFLKINFSLNENPNAKSGEKTYYIQIIDGKNNVLGKRITEYFDNESLTYSLSKTINYNNQQLDCGIEFIKKDFEKGVYYINIFDRNELVGKTSFTLN